MKTVTRFIYAILAVMILSACAATTTTTKCQCDKPSLDPSGVSDHAGNDITVRVKTNTPGAKLRYTLTGITPTNGSIPADHGDVTFHIEVYGRTLTAVAYKLGCTDSPPAVGHYGP